MKYLPAICLIFMFISVSSLHAQQEYTVDGQTYSLKTEVEGSLSLLWNTIDNNYRYFSRKGSEVVELKNSKLDGKYQEEYKEQCPDGFLYGRLGVRIKRYRSIEMRPLN